jgi:hypothetical protein
VLELASLAVGFVIVDAESILEKPLGKAMSALLSDGRRELVNVTVAPADPNHVDSDQYPNLLQAMLDAGDPV